MTNKRRTRTSDPLSAADQALWQAYTQTVQPLTIKPTAFYPSSPSALNQTKSQPQLQSQRIDADQYYRALTVTAIYRSASYEAIPVAPNLSRKKLKQPVIIDGRLDLHGMTQNQAYAVMLRFIDSHYQRYHRTLLVITGKGFMRQYDRTREHGRISLAEALPQWLSQPPLNAYVQSFSVARDKDGGQGACYIYLRRK